MIQLKERFPFCKAPDAIMADLFQDLGDCYLETKSYEYAKAFYQVAVEYYKSTDPELSLKIEKARALRVKYEHTGVVADYKTSGGTNNQKITGVPYKELLNTHSEHTINWKGITTDPNTLLSYLGLNNKPVNKPHETVQEPDSAKTSLATKHTDADRGILYTWVISTSLIVFVAAAWIYRKTRKKRY